MKKIFLVLIFSLSLFANENYKVSLRVEVSGLVLNKLSLNVEELEKMSYFKSGSTPVICMSGETKDNVERYEGVLLKDYQGKIALISIDDIRNGPRHIKWLEKIVVGKI